MRRYDSNVVFRVELNFKNTRICWMIPREIKKKEKLHYDE